MPGKETKHDRCVEHVKENSPEVTNPHAVCVAQGVYPEKWKKSMTKTEKESLVKALDEVGLRESAMNLDIWDELDETAARFVENLSKSLDNEFYDEVLEKKYTGFKKLKGKLAGKGAYNPGALAAYIGRQKYGAKKFQHAAKKGKKMRGMKAK
jgi:hypothetical protein